MADLEPLPDVVRRVRLLPPEERTAYLQSIMGAPTDNPMELHRRALLVTALNEARLWPHGCPGAGEAIPA